MNQNYIFDSIKMCCATDVNKYIEIPTDFKFDNFERFIKNEPNTPLQNNVYFTFDLVKEVGESDFFQRVRMYFDFIKENQPYILKISFCSPCGANSYQKEINVQLLLETCQINSSEDDLREFRLDFIAVKGSRIKEVSYTQFE